MWPVYNFKNVLIFSIAVAFSAACVTAPLGVENQSRTEVLEVKSDYIYQVLDRYLDDSDMQFAEFHLIELKVIRDGIRQAIKDDLLEYWMVNNWYRVTLAQANWESIIDLVEARRDNMQLPIPVELKSFIDEVEYVFESIQATMKANSNVETGLKLLELLVYILTIVVEERSGAVYTDNSLVV